VLGARSSIPEWDRAPERGTRLVAALGQRTFLDGKPATFPSASSTARFLGPFRVGVMPHYSDVGGP
jgi:hypothetical protein